MYVAADNITYLELGVCPARHASLIPEQAVLDAVNAELLKAPFAAHIVILVNIAKDSPIAVQRMAELAVSNADRNIVGFETVTAEISAEKMRFFQPTFDFLRDHFVSVSMFAGEKDPRTIPIAIVTLIIIAYLIGSIPLINVTFNVVTFMESVGCYGAKPKNYRDRYGDLRDTIRENAALLNDLYHFEQTMIPHINNLKEDQKKLEIKHKELEDSIKEYKTKIKQEEDRMHENQRVNDFSELKQQIREKENEFEQLMIRRCELLAKAEEM